jgi:hypothetical protein
MTSVQATSAAARLPSDPSGRDTARSRPTRGLAGLIDVLDRADNGTGSTRPVRHRSAASSRAGAGRGVPLRSVRPAPPARPVPSPLRVVVDDPAPTDWTLTEGAGGVSATAPAQLTPLMSLVRGVALWGAGPQGEYLAWRGAAPAPIRPDVVRPAAVPPAAVVRPAEGPSLLTSLVRRAALWGAGPQGEYLAWSAGPPRAAVQHTRADVDRPVVLRELPSTPTVQPVASSPATALVADAAPSPAESVALPARSGSRPPVRPVAARLPAGPSVAMPSARTSQPTGWPTRPPRQLHRPTAQFPAAGSGPIRARGDPLSYPARGSPRPPPRPAPRAPG